MSLAADEERNTRKMRKRQIYFQLFSFSYISQGKERANR
jgi:hypothetical protein